jgi:transposase-like protein
MIARRLGVSEPTLYRWRDEFLAAGEAALVGGNGKPGVDPRERRIAELEAQIEKRDQIIGEYTVANRILKNFRVNPLECREPSDDRRRTASADRPAASAADGRAAVAWRRAVELASSATAGCA